MQVGRLEILPIRIAFPNEARHFTTWLEAQIDAIAERLGLKLTCVQREKAVGSFNVDLLCEDENGRPVIIENQLEATNHDHMGKVLTYLVNLDAAAAIWITSEARPEHRKVIDWLNESTPADVSFYLVKAEAVRIGDSPPAPLFTVVSSPSAELKEAGHRKKEWAEQNVKKAEFWESLLELSRDKTRLFSNIKPSKGGWISTGAGKGGLSFNYVARLKSACIELYIDTGDREQNKTIFDALYEGKESIEQEFGGSLDWQRMPDKQASRIEKRFQSGGIANPDSWPALQDKMIDAMIRFEAALRPRIAEL